LSELRENNVHAAHNHAKGEKLKQPLQGYKKSNHYKAIRKERELRP